MKQSDFLDPEAQKWFVELLHEGIATVKFTKTDGTEREMRCTLMENQIPGEKAPKNSTRKQNSDVLAVFDVEKQGWRSFRWDSIKEFVIDIT